MRQNDQPEFTEAAAERTDVLRTEYDQHLREESISIAKAQRGQDVEVITRSDVDEADKRLRPGPPPRLKGVLRCVGTALMALGTPCITLVIQGLSSRIPRWLSPGVFVPVLITGIVLFAVGLTLYVVGSRD